MTAETSITALPFWSGRPQLTPIDSGRTNRNFLAEDDGRRYFVRRGEDIPHLGISRQAERLAHARAAAAGLAPAIRYAEGPILITDFIEGSGLGPLTADKLAMVARLLKDLHRIPADDGLPLFCPATIALAYLDRLGDGELPFDRAKIRERLRTLPRAAAQNLVHGDLIPENFILCDGGGLALIDWEYAGNGQAEADIALLIANFDLAPDAVREFIAAYGGADSGLVAQFQIAAVIREALWCFVQQRYGTPSPDLPAYAARCVERVERMTA